MGLEGLQAGLAGIPVDPSSAISFSTTRSLLAPPPPPRAALTPARISYLLLSEGSKLLHAFVKGIAGPSMGCWEWGSFPTLYLVVTPPSPLGFSSKISFLVKSSPLPQAVLVTSLCSCSVLSRPVLWI